MTEVRDRLMDRDALAVEDARHLRVELAVTRLLPSLDPRMEPLLEAAMLALGDVSDECSLEAALEAFSPVLDVLAGWPAPLGAPPWPDEAGPARRPASWPDRRVVRLAAVIVGLEALAHGRESELGRRLALESVDLSREWTRGVWWLPMAAVAPRSAGTGGAA